MPAEGRAWHFLQSSFWAEHKESFGWRAVFVAPGGRSDAGSREARGSEARRSAQRDPTHDSAPILTLTRRLPAGLLLTYVPYAPALGGEQRGVPGPDGEALAALIADLVPRVRRTVRTVAGEPALIRFDLPQRGDRRPDGSTATALRESSHLLPAPVEVQPPTTVVLELEQEPEELLGAMHKKNRYNIRLSERKGVRVRAAGADELSRWYELYRETAARDAIAIHSFAYYTRLFELAVSHPRVDLRLYLAEHGDALLAGIIVVHYAGGATYLYGASSNEKRNLMPNYALQWHAITRARDAGCEWYDLFGIPPADDPAHPMHGLYRFKTGFGGRIVHRLGAWDASVRPIAAGAFRLAERARDVYLHRMRRFHGG